MVPPSGNMWVGGQQFWLSPARAGQKVTLWMDTTTVHLSIGGWRVKTVPSRLTEVDLARLRRSDGRPAGPPPGGPSPGALASSRCVEADRLVNGIDGVTLLNRLILVGSPLAGQRAATLPAFVSGIFHVRFWLFMLGALAAGVFWIGIYVGISYLLGEEIAKLVGKIGTKALIGVIILVVAGLLIRAGLSKWRASRQARLAQQEPAQG